ncbi:MAG: hypothetical protein AB7O66_03370 [Limisphaerales bacterium]
MDDPIERLIRELRNETCPPSVLDQVSRAIPRGKTPKRPRGPAWAWGALAGLASLVLVIALLWPGSARRDENRLVGEVRPETDHALVLEQTHAALAAIGHVLIQAGSSAESAVRQEAGPPFIKSLQTAKTLITHPL